MSRIHRAALALSLVAAACLTGCASSSAQAPNDGASTGRQEGSSFTEVAVKLSDGRTVLCVKDITGAGQAISCDWSGAKW